MNNRLRKSDRSTTEERQDIQKYFCTNVCGNQTKVLRQLCTRVEECEDMSGVYTCSLSLQTGREKTEQSTRIFQDIFFLGKVQQKCTKLPKTFSLDEFDFVKTWVYPYMERCVCMTLRVGRFPWCVFCTLSIDKNR